jgi:hypothetical protein
MRKESLNIIAGIINPMELKSIFLWQYSRKKLVHVTLFPKHRKMKGGRKKGVKTSQKGGKGGSTRSSH